MRRNKYLDIRRSLRTRRLINRFSLGADFLHDEAALSHTSAADYMNFRVDGGVLTDGWGIESYDALAGISDIASAWEHTRYDGGGRITEPMYCDKSGVVHVIKNGENLPVDGAVFTSPPLAIGYRLYGKDVTFVCSPTDGMAVYDGNVLKPVEPSPKITGMTLHYERLFATTSNEPDSVRFSDDLDPTDWAEGLDSGGFVQLADCYGRSNKVVSFMNYVYIFRDYGISRMVAYADQTEFSVSNLYVSSGRIYPDSVTVCGDRVIFLASDGLYAFDGLSTRRLLPRYGDVTKQKESAVGRFFDGKFYLAYSGGGEHNDSLLVYDIALEIAELSRGVRIDRFMDGENLVAVSDGSAVRITPCGAALGVPTHKLWRVPFNSLSSPDRLKRLHEISVETATDIELKVICDERERTFALKGGEGIRRIKVGMRGKKLGIEITADSVGTRIAEFGFITS